MTDFGEVPIPDIVEVQSETSIERRIAEPVLNRITEFQEFEEFINNLQLVSGRRGTLHVANPDAYVYIKPGFGSDTEEQARHNLQAAQYLTDCGIFYPHTAWGITRDRMKPFTLFAVTRALERFSPEGQEKSDRQHILTRREIETMLGHKPDEVELSLALLDRDDSHVKSLIQRVITKPALSSKETEARKKMIYRLLNTQEASWSDNWGWDTNSGLAYPLDMEVISFEGNEEVVNSWLETKT